MARNESGSAAREPDGPSRGRTPEREAASPSSRRPAGRENIRLTLLALPALVVFAAFWLLPMARLVAVGASGPRGLGAYLAIVTDRNYFASLVSTITLSIGVTFATLV